MAVLGREDSGVKLGSIGRRINYFAERKSICTHRSNNIGWRR